MGERVENLEQEVDELRREVSGFNRKLGSLELKINAVKDLMMGIIASLPQREDGDELLREYLEAGGGGAEKLSQRRLELPVFSGEDACGWVLKVEKYFMLNGIGDEEKVAYASLSMKGEALIWLLAMEAGKAIHDWEMFKHELMERFKAFSHFEQLMSLKQTTTVALYNEQFELLSAPIINDISEEMLRSIFLNGLNDDIKDGLRYYSYVIESLRHAMSLSLQIEEELKISDMKDKGKCVSAFEELGSLRQSTTVAEYRKTFQLLSAPIIRHMSEDMLIRTFINGLNDDETKGKVNSAGLRSLTQVMSLAQEMEDRKRTSNMMGETQKLSMDSNVATKPHSFKFLGKIGTREVIVLVGTATTRNLISKELVTALQIPLLTGPEAEGGKVCKGILLKAQGINIVQRYYPIKLGIADVVLGGEWLGSLGSYAIRGSPMSITFKRLGSTVTLQADPSLTTGLDTEVKNLVE